jgi:hypothetical protein
LRCEDATNVFHKSFHNGSVEQRKMEENTMIKVSMRKALLMVATTVAIGAVGTAGGSAAPIEGGAVGKASDSMSTVTHVQHWRWGSGGHWRWGSGGHWRWGSRGHHWRWGSRRW